MVKVAFIGAGSVEFTRNVVTDLCSFGELHGNLELSLHDIDAERLGYADALAKRISAHGPITFEISDGHSSMAYVQHGSDLQTGAHEPTVVDKAFE